MYSFYLIFTAFKLSNSTLYFTVIPSVLPFTHLREFKGIVITILSYYTQIIILCIINITFF